MDKSKLYDGVIQDTKNRIIVEINKLIAILIIPGELEYVELPHRIPLKTIANENLDDVIMAVEKDVAIVNTMFNEPKLQMNSLSLECLNSILKQVEIYKEKNY